MNGDSGGSGEPEDEAERRLRQMFLSTAVPKAPDAARDFLRSVAAGNGPGAHSFWTQPPLPGRRLGRVLPALAIGGLVLAVVVTTAAIFLTNRSPAPAYQAPSPAPSMTGSQAPKPSPSATVTPSPTQSSIAGNATGGLVWTRTSTAEGVTFDFVIGDGQGFLAGGTNANGYPPRMWRSSDGLSWQEEPLSRAFVDSDPSKYFYAVSRVARAPGTTHLVAVGTRLYEGSTNSGDAAAWYSSDGGSSWTRAAQGPEFANAEISDVVAGPNGWVAVGLDGFPSGGTQMVGVNGAAVWTSTDGLHWTKQPTQDSFAGGFMSRVVRTGQGFVASGGALPGATN